MISIEYLRSFRIADYAIFDFAVSYIAVFLLAPLLSRWMGKIGITIRMRNWLLLTLPISILIHILVGNFTPMTRDFLDLHGHYILKGIIIGFFITGLYGIKYQKK